MSGRVNDEPNYRWKPIDQARAKDGEIVTVVGPNGSGKTTLMKALIGAIAPHQGSVTCKPGTTICYVPQMLNIDATMSLNVTRFLNLPRSRPSKATKAALERVGLGELGALISPVLQTSTR